MEEPKHRFPLELMTRPVPHSRYDEEVVLAALFRGIEVPDVTADDFFLEEHSRMFRYHDVTSEEVRNSHPFVKIQRGLIRLSNRHGDVTQDEIRLSLKRLSSYRRLREVIQLSALTLEEAYGDHESIDDFIDSFASEAALIARPGS